MERLILISGGQGSGKSTLARLLVEWYLEIKPRTKVTIFEGFQPSMLRQIHRQDVAIVCLQTEPEPGIENMFDCPVQLIQISLLK